MTAHSLRGVQAAEPPILDNGAVQLEDADPTVAIFGLSSAFADLRNEEVAGLGVVVGAFGCLDSFRQFPGNSEFALGDHGEGGG